MTPERKAAIRRNFKDTAQAYKEAVENTVREKNVDSAILAKVAVSPNVKLSQFLGNMMSELRRNNAALKARVEAQHTIDAVAELDTVFNPKI